MGEGSGWLVRLWKWILDRFRRVEAPSQPPVKPWLNIRDARREAWLKKKRYEKMQKESRRKIRQQEV